MESSPLKSPKILDQPGDSGGSSGSVILPQFGDINGWEGGAKSIFSVPTDGDVGRDIGTGDGLGRDDPEQVTAGTELHSVGAVLCSPILS